ncbi:MAG: alpha/beta fold hydrolase [Myxococcota bacterium]
MDSYEVLTSDGWRLAVNRLAHSGPRRGAVLMLPAMMVDARTLDRPAGAGLGSCLAAYGFDVHIADLRGHGGSGPTVSEGGDWCYDDLVFRDVPALVEAVRERDPGVVWVLGHSLGSHVSLAAAAAGAHTFAPDGHVLIAGNVWMPSLEGSRRMRLKKHAIMRLFRRTVSLIGHWPSRAFRMGPADESLPYVQDITRFWFNDEWGSRDGRYDYGASMCEVAGPVLEVCGAGDRLLSSIEGTRAFIEQLGPGRAEVWYLREGDLGLTWNPTHMGLVTDSRSEPIWHAIARWMVERTTPSGASSNDQ